MTKQHLQGFLHMLQQAKSLSTGFGHSLVESLPRTLGLYAVGTSVYLFVALLVAIVALRKSHGLCVANVFGRMFPRRLYADYTARITHWHFALYTLFWAPIFALLTFTPTLAASAVSQELDKALSFRHPLLHSGTLVVTVQSAIIILSMSLASYLHHYASHRIPVLWSFHRAHHSVECLTLPANAREHPFDLFTIQLLMNVFAAVFGGLTLHLTGTALHPTTFLIVGLGAATYFSLFGIFNHSHLPLSLGWFNRILMAPILHQFHHSAELRHRDTNIGSFCGLMIWDWMFGTLYLPKKGETYRWGLNEEQLGPNNPHQRLREFYLEPIVHAWGLIRDEGLGCLRPSPRPNLDDAATR